MMLDLWKLLTVALSIIAILILLPSFTGSFIIGERVRVELFIMSYCPYGTQALKGILPAIEALGGSVDFNLRFVDYVMHGKPEIDENLREYCIQEEQPLKLIPYLYCFLEQGDWQSCLTSVRINTNLINNCINRTDDEFNITSLYNDQETWLSGYYPQFNVNTDLNDDYGIRGLPTLVINGEQASPSDRSPQAFLNIICRYFNNDPPACSQQLSTQVPSTGFGFSSSSTSTGSCS
jgi:hypothetical protein